MAGSQGLIVCFGEMLIDFVPTVSGVSLADAPGFLKAPGGAPANVAIAVARLGGKAAFSGKLGDDEFGHMLAGILKENKVSADGVTFDKGARTALAFVTLRADGEREFMFYRNPSADMLLKPEELNLELIRSVSISFAVVISHSCVCAILIGPKMRVMHDSCCLLAKSESMMFVCLFDSIFLGIFQLQLILASSEGSMNLTVITFPMGV